MNFSPQQEQALDAIGHWIRFGQKPYFNLQGFAGTGKTTLARHIAENADGPVTFAAFTGKAAAVLTSKGCPASTIHSLIYLPSSVASPDIQKVQAQIADTPKGDTARLEELKQELQQLMDNHRSVSFHKRTKEESALTDYSLLIVDESSMIDEQMFEDLLSFGVPILAMGDPGQLPPTFGVSPLSKQKPDFLLTDIHRQALDNPIIRLSMQVRESSGRLALGEYGESRVIKNFDEDEARRCNQVLVGTNKSRQRFNSWMRKQLKHDDPLPQVGEKLICTKNNKNNDPPLLNGELWDVTEAARLLDYRPDFVEMGLRAADGTDTTVTAHKWPYIGQKSDYSHFDLIDKSCNWFEFGYAITVHKSQGSQWDSVYICDESRVFRNLSRQWLYTAITRASDRIVLQLK